MSGSIKAADRLCLMSKESYFSLRPFSNIFEYCFGDRDAVLSYLVLRGRDVAPLRSDFELFKAVWDESAESGSSVAMSIKNAVEGLLGNNICAMGAEEVWSAAADILSEKTGKTLFLPDLDEIGIAVLPNENAVWIPDVLGSAKTVPTVCPFGTVRFDAEYFPIHCSASSVIERFTRVAVFAKGYIFEEPNEYIALRTAEKLSLGQKVSNRESNLLSSQLFRSVAIGCAREGKELMLFLPPAPDVISMGQLASMLEYLDATAGSDTLSVTIFACDAVGICFASSLMERKYKKITAVTGLSGNGCGIPDESYAGYWGLDRFPIIKASLSRTPAFIG